MIVEKIELAPLVATGPLGDPPLPPPPTVIGKDVAVTVIAPHILKDLLCRD